MGDEWRMEGVPEDKRYESTEEAIRRAKEIEKIKPQRLQGSREAKSLRPDPIVAKRIYHSRGHKWDEFREEIGGKVKDHELLSFMDHDEFGRWKQAQYEGWTVEKREVVLDMANTANPIPPEPKKKKSKRKKKKKKHYGGDDSREGPRASMKDCPL
jgi:type I site-specific restriction-modification system R (restriction) subunit